MKTTLVFAVSALLCFGATLAKPSNSNEQSKVQQSGGSNSNTQEKVQQKFSGRRSNTNEQSKVQQSGGDNSNSQSKIQQMGRHENVDSRLQNDAKAQNDQPNQNDGKNLNDAPNATDQPAKSKRQNSAFKKPNPQNYQRTAQGSRTRVCWPWDLNCCGPRGCDRTVIVCPKWFE